jgi:hypothetical protein
LLPLLPPPPLQRKSWLGSPCPCSRFFNDPLRRTKATQPRCHCLVLVTTAAVAAVVAAVVVAAVVVAAVVVASAVVAAVVVASAASVLVLAAPTTAPLVQRL